MFLKLHPLASYLFLLFLIRPHRLEDPDAPETKEFVAQQVELANRVLAECNNRDVLKEKVTSMYNYPRYGCPNKIENRFFYSHNSGLQAQSVLYVQVWPLNRAFSVISRLDY